MPLTALRAFSELFSRLGPKRGLNYSLATNLYSMVKEAGFISPSVEIHQPAGCDGDTGTLLTWSVMEAGPAFVSAGLITARQLRKTLADMEEAAKDPEVLALAPRMSVVWARKGM